MIIVSGFNVFPNEIEAIVGGCDGVAECACVGVVDGKTGEAVKIYVVKTTNAVLDADTLAAYCRERLTAYKVPKRQRAEVRPKRKSFKHRPSGSKCPAAPKTIRH